jgi:hypothetical protein
MRLSSTESLKERARAIKETSDTVSKQTGETVSNALKQQYGEFINRITQQNEQLQKQLSEQGKTVQAMSGSNIFTGKGAIPVTIAEGPKPMGEAPPELHVARTTVPARPEYGKYAEQFILTTNKVMNGGRVEIACRGKLTHGDATLAGAGAQMTNGDGLVDEHTFQSGINSPNWSPPYPLVVTLYANEDIGACNVRPQM